MVHNNKTSFAFTTTENQDIEDFMRMAHAGHMPMLAVRDNVLFSGMVMPIHVERKISIRTLKHAQRHDLLVGVFTQTDPRSESTEVNDYYPYGVVAKIVHMMEMPEGSYTILLQAMNRVRLVDVTRSRTGLECDVIVAPELLPTDGERLEYQTTLDLIKDYVVSLGETITNFPTEMLQYIKSIEPSTFMLGFTISNLPTEMTVKQNLMKESRIIKRATETLALIKNVLNLAQLKRKIEHKTQVDLDKQQREYFLNQEIRNMQAELGGKDEVGAKEEDIEQLKMKAMEINWPEKTEEAFTRELEKLNRMNVQSADYNVQLNYLHTLVNLPWGIYTTDNINLKTAERCLNRDHYGMDKVKERIMEYLAVLKLRHSRKSPILCLYGPPGVGKTSLGKSIAEALKRKYVRISLGGMHDESEIRGHRRTYIGAMPGRIISAMQKAGSCNPVFVLDEIDKVTQANVNGDPSSALLEVLDPEQNSAFHDNFLDVDFDLSSVMFIATANDISAIPPALLDRMELIEVSGYLTEEKIEIAKRHLVPKKKEENGLGSNKGIRINKDALEFIIERYTRESGVRALEKQIDKLCRKIALSVASEKITGNQSITAKETEEFLGKPRFSRDQYQGNDFAGVVTGLAWTSVGGEILFIETSVSKSKAPRLTLTGNLGDVMKESAMLACEYIRAHAEKWDIDPRIFEQYSLHIHVPEGAVPKDGPSAGVTMATSIVSALTQRKVGQRLAMTGEITLRGKVLPVGGIKEKILAAKRAGITSIMLCQENRKDIEEIPEIYVSGVDFHYVDTIQDVLDYALLPEKVANAMTFEIEEKEN